MIAYIHGTVHALREESIIVLVGGIGYAVSVPARVIGSTHIGAEITLHTHHHVREDALDLYGFVSEHDLQVFQRLIQVSGVGPRMAMTIASQLKAEEISQAVASGDIAALKAVSGVGKKTAERIVIDLKDSVAEWTVASIIEDGTPQNLTAVVALEGLGFSENEAKHALSGVDTTLPIEEQVREALKSSAAA